MVRPYAKDNTMPQLITETILKKVLIIDDSVHIHQAYKMMLNRYKCKIITALDGEEGLNHLINNPDINLLIVDMKMPRMSGTEFIRRLRELGSYDHIPIIAISSDGMDYDAGEAIAFAQGDLRKPFTSTELHTAIRNLFSCDTQ